MKQPRTSMTALSLLLCLCCSFINTQPQHSHAQRTQARAPAAVATSGITDRRVYVEPALPALPRAGGKFHDPTFGTELMRVTDERDGASNGTFYAYWPTFNADATRLLVRRAGGDSIYDFDPDTFTLGTRRDVPRLPDGGALVTEGAVWSATDPHTLYATAWNGPRLWALDARTLRYTLVYDFGARGEMAATDFLWQMSASDDGDTFAFTHKNRSYKVVGYTVFKRSLKRVILETKVSGLNEVRVDKTGRYLVISPDGADGQGHVCLIRDLQTGTVDGLVDGAPDYAPGHGDIGAGVLVAWDNDDNRLLYRRLAAPHTFRPVLNLGGDWMNLHVSLLGGNDDWALVSFYSYRTQPTPGLFHNELVLVSTDGSQRVRRVAHHRSIAQDYWDTPRANLSRDGRFVAFSSNWGGQKRQDLFIARLDPPPTTSGAQPQTAPTIHRRPRRVNPPNE